MKRKTVGIIDYGVGNHASIIGAFQHLNYRCKLTRVKNDLAKCDLLVLPGVGAYPKAMSNLATNGLVQFIKDRAMLGQPIIGLCLGMQLLTDASYENELTAGIGLIPGRVIPLKTKRAHIGWNTIEVTSGDELLEPSNNQSFYFNHSYICAVPNQFVACTTKLDQNFSAGIRRGNVVGLQFHPEKSQSVGRTMLRNLVEGLTNG